MVIEGNSCSDYFEVIMSLYSLRDAKRNKIKGLKVFTFLAIVLSLIFYPTATSTKCLRVSLVVVSRTKSAKRGRAGRGGAWWLSI